MSESFKPVPVEEAMLDVAAAVGLASPSTTTNAEIQRRAKLADPEKETAPELGRMARLEQAVDWFENQDLSTFGVQDALARWGVHGHGQRYHIEKVPESGEEMLPSPWALKAMLEDVAQRADITVPEAADLIDGELRLFMISADLCEAGHDVNCIARVTTLSGTDVSLEINARSGEIGLRQEFQEEIPDEPELLAMRP
ncbi:hypothetical protein Salmuc_01330 [Salipiger mucosus DSM 16094]|uniref:Uncharacterized protein n=2 Tax=Salipiger mucosus TaxID=263378 RepID=S9QYT6_9RHOB|nr:hypothetical protein Salmuc_01330 [Salipiger mucosus DSM 16094]